MYGTMVETIWNSRLGSPPSGYVQRFFSPRFRSRIAKILEGVVGCVVAVLLGDGESGNLMDQSTIEGGKAEAVGDRRPLWITSLSNSVRVDLTFA